MKLKPFEIKPLPKPLALKYLIGPSFIILGLGLGSGEVILWPFLSSEYGLGIIWAAIIGITLQFFMNMEIERYTLVRGESIFVGFARKSKVLPFWFLFSTFIPWIWPGIIAASATLLGGLVGFENTQLLSIIFLLVIGLILTFGPVLYKTVEGIQKFLIVVGVPFIFILAIVLAGPSDYAALGKGMVGIGDGYMFLPAGISIATFLAALAYAGAGGNLNLAQSFFVREKGYGMAKYAGRITSLFTGKKEKVVLEGAKFEVSDESLSNFKVWWKNINLEHLIVFWFIGAVTIILLSLLAYTTVYGVADSSGIEFIVLEAEYISNSIFPVAGAFFILIAGLMLFSTQLGVFDATSRILTENILLAKKKEEDGHNVSKIYYVVLWAQILSGILIFALGFTQPLQLIVLAAVLNAFAMFVHVGLTLWLNKTSLDMPVRPNLLRTTVMLFAFLFYGGFSLYTLIETFL